MAFLAKERDEWGSQEWREYAEFLEQRGRDMLAELERKEQKL
jgi:hypothetical protein